MWSARVSGGIAPSPPVPCTCYHCFSPAPTFTHTCLLKCYCVPATASLHRARQLDAQSHTYLERRQELLQQIEALGADKARAAAAVAAAQNQVLRWGGNRGRNRR